MNDRESLMDHWIDRAVQAYGNSEHELKLYCARASFVVGRYELGATQAIAQGIKRSVSSVENHAHAHKLYSTLRASPFRSCVRTLWRSLPASHWWLAWEINKAGYDALYYLNNAQQHGESGRAMMESYKRDREAGNAPLVYKRGLLAVHGIISELMQKHAAAMSENLHVAFLGVVEAIESETAA